MTTDPPKIPDVEFRGKVRGRGHKNTWIAAAKLNRKQELVVKSAIPLILQTNGPQTHDGIYSIYRKAGGKRTPQRIRTATASLVVEGLVWSHDDDGTSVYGGPSQRWAA